jgi:hypothetical protein
MPYTTYARERNVDVLVQSLQGGESLSDSDGDISDLSAFQISQGRLRS